MSVAFAHPGCSPSVEARRRDSLRIVLSPRRMFWAVLLVLHAAALPGLCLDLATPDPDSARLATLLRLLSLISSLAVFALKLFDVPWLRIPKGWHGQVSVLIVVALLHWGVVVRVAEGEAHVNAAPWSMALALGGVSCAAPLTRRLHQLMLFRTARDGDTSLSSARGRGVHAAWLDLVPAPRLLLVPSLSTPRSPPLC